MDQLKTHHIAALTQAIYRRGDAIQLLPAGEFRSIDGRPAECSTWRLNAACAARLIAQASARKTPFCIDYEHQSLNAAKSGTPAPAAGWFAGSTLEWREPAGDEPGGLYALAPDWTASAASMIAAGEYRFISPVFAYDPKTGNVLALLNAALTNNPALDGLDDVAIAAASLLAACFTPTEDNPMKDLLAQLCWLFSLPATATIDDVKVPLTKLQDQLSGGKGLAAASINLAELLAEREGRIAALTATQIDPAKFVPVDTMRALQTQIAALTAQVNDTAVDDLVQTALSDGRLLAAQEPWARELAKTNIAALAQYIESAPRIAALTSQQTKGKAPPGVESVEKTPAAIAAMARLYQDEQAKAGVVVSASDAVTHVSKELN